jgi:hypothetical protein
MGAVRVANLTPPASYAVSVLLIGNQSGLQISTQVDNQANAKRGFFAGLRFPRTTNILPFQRGLKKLLLLLTFKLILNIKLIVRLLLGTIMAKIQIKIEVSLSVEIPFWSVTIGSAPNVVLHFPGNDFGPLTNGLYTSTQSVDVQGPVVNVELSIGTANPAWGASCRVTVGTGKPDPHFLNCTGNSPFDDYNYVIPPEPAQPQVKASAAGA